MRRENNYGQLGLDIDNSWFGADTGNDLAYLNLGTDESGAQHKALQIASGPYAKHTCAILDNKKVKCWGYNIYGQLGYGDKINVGKVEKKLSESSYVDFKDDTFIPKQITVNNLRTCALSEDGRVKCWGKKYRGELALVNNYVPQTEPPEDFIPVTV